MKTITQVSRTNKVFAFLLCTLSVLCSLCKQAEAQKISCTAGHSLAICNNGTIRAWGRNFRGELGDGTNTTRNTPVQVNGLTGVTAVIAGGNVFSLFLKNDSTVWACGGDAYGQLGNGAGTDKSNPVKVAGLTGITAIAAGWGHSLFLKNDGTVWACGYNSDGQLGDGNWGLSKYTPVKVPALSGIIAISAGLYHSLFLKNDGTVWACGRNNYGQLGDSSLSLKITPVRVKGLVGIIALAAGGNHSLFLKNDGTAWGCGANNSGQFGDGTNTGKNIPVQIPGLSGITALAGGWNHSLFLKNDGSAWTCGLNTYSQLGDGTTANRNTPAQVSGLTGITAMAGGSGHSMFLKNDGSVWTCGLNADGQLGDGTNTDNNTLVQPLGLCVVASGTGELSSLRSQAELYPNPFTNSLRIQLYGTAKSSHSEIILYNILGDEILRSAISNSNEEIKTGSLPDGIYIYHIQCGNEIMRKGKVVKQF